MKILGLSLLALTLSTAYALPQQTIVTVQRAQTVSAGPQKNQAHEEVAFEFEKTRTLLENSRSSKTPTTLTLPLGNNETTELSVQGKTNHVGQIVWKEGHFVPIEHPYLSFEGTTKEGGRVRGFISEQSFSAIIHSTKSERILVQSKSLHVDNDTPTSLQTALIDDVIESPEKKLLSPSTPSNLTSPVDAGGFVQLRHLGMLFTLTDKRFHAIDPNGNAYQYNQQVTDWVAAFAQQIDDVLKSRLGVTIESIGDGQAEKHGWYYYVELPGGYPGQPADTIFPVDGSDTDIDPRLAENWAIINDNFQKWMVQNSNPTQQLAIWWDTGIALGGQDVGIGGPYNDNPGGGVGDPYGLCHIFGKGRAYAHVGTQRGLSIALHEIGHNLGALHSFSSQNGGCGNGSMSIDSAVEPGSGSTLMGYPGLCWPDNVQSQGDFYFHAKSIHQINDHLIDVDSQFHCISYESTMNRPPVLKLAPDPSLNAVPKGTRFEINARFEDPELEDLKQLAIDNNDPAWIPTDAKNYGAGYVNVEQCNALSETWFLPPLYRSFAPRHTDPLPSSIVLDYPTHYKHSFPQETNPQGSQWDPLINTPGKMKFCITGWDNYGSPSNNFPAFVSTYTYVDFIDLPKPVFTFPQAGQTITADASSNVTWIPNFAGYQTQFSSITLSYKDPKKGWDDLTWEFNAPGYFNNFPTVKFPKQPYETSYTTQLRLEYKTLGDVTWFVESPPFEVQDKRIFYSGFE